MNKINIGQEFENIAYNYLLKNGFKIIERNFTCKIGEIDIIAKIDNTLVFVEVRGKTSGDPREAITENKIFRVRRMAEFYLSKYKLWDEDIRFDAILIKKTGSEYHIDHIPEAF